MRCIFIAVLAMVTYSVVESNPHKHRTSIHTHLHKWGDRPKVCRKEKETGEKMAFCPSHTPGDSVDWPCVRFSDLCNGLRDCPDGEDENSSMCMFHNLQNSELDGLRRSVFSFFVEREARGEEENLDQDDN